MFRQIYLAEGPTGPNKEYLFKLEDVLNKIGKVATYVFIFLIEQMQVCPSVMRSWQVLWINMFRIWRMLCASMQRPCNNLIRGSPEGGIDCCGNIFVPVRSE